MNVALFSFAYAPFEGGAEIAAREIISRLKTLNFTVFTYKLNKKWASEESGPNFKIIRIGAGKKMESGEKDTRKYYGGIWKKINYVYRAWQEAEKAHRRERFDAVWVMMASYGGLAALLFKMKHPKVPMLLTLQEGDSARHMTLGKFGLVGLLGGRIIRNADFIQCISHYLADFAALRGAKCPIEVVSNGVDIGLFQTPYSDSEIKSARNNLGLKDEYVIITTNRLVYKNGMDIVVKALAKLKEKRPNIKLVAIGDGPELNKLKTMGKKLKVDGDILFLGQMPYKDLPLYFRIADVFVRPSRSEGFGNAFLDAMAAGVPAIGTPVGGIVDFLKDGETGFVSKPENPDDLAEKINYVLGHPNVRNKVIANADNLVKRHYSWDVVSEKMGRIFNHITS